MDFLNSLSLVGASEEITAVSRLILPALALVIVIRCAVSMLTGRGESEIWGYIALPNGAKCELVNWENIVGRGRSSDVTLGYKSVSRTHAALTRDDMGHWSVMDLGSKGGTRVRGREIDEPTALRSGDSVEFGGVSCTFVASTAKDERDRAKLRQRPGVRIRPGITLMMLTLFTLILGVQHTAAAGEELNVMVPVTFLALVAVFWGCYLITRALDRTGFELEILAFFLVSVGFSVCAGSDPEALFKELMCLAAGLVLYFVIGWYLRDLNRARRMRTPMAAVGLGLLIVNLLTAKSIFGAKNWLSIAGISFQPSEFVKICFIFTGAATLDRLFARRNLIAFVGFAAASVGCLAAMSDFGTAAVFFVTYIIIAFMRSGSFATVFLSVAGTGLGAFIVMTARPYVMRRFATWGHAWDFPQAGGFQQTRTMAGAASGGLFGLGGGRGWLHRVFAADTDMVFGVVCEELGLIMGILTVAAILIIAVFAIRSAGSARSSFYAIAASAAVTVMLTQLILNVFGSLDILPFTGVTFPLVSKGGSSLIATFGLLAFVKAADTRQNASFAIRAGRKRERRRPDREEAERE